MILSIKSESEKGSQAKTKKSKHVGKSKETLYNIITAMSNF